MPKIGRYVELPLPEAWLPILEPLCPVKLRLNRAKTPSASRLLQLTSESLHERELQLLFLRYGRGYTLEQIGTEFDLTRERVRQIELMALRKIRGRAGRYDQTLSAWLEQIEKSGFIVADVPHEVFHLQPEATPDELWLCALSVYAKTLKNYLQTVKLPCGGWITYDTRRINDKALKKFFDSKRRFMSLEETAQDIRVDAYDLIHGWSFFDGVYLTASGSLGSSRWTTLSYIEAVAWELEQEGFTEWHFSEMAQALKLIYPEKFSHLISRNVAAALSRKDAAQFQHAGRKGVWQLKAVGDGYHNNRSAVAAVLERSSMPLHYAEIIRRLERPIRPETIYALLSRDEMFRSYGDGIYGLSNQSYGLFSAADARPESSAEADDFELTELLLDILSNGDASSGAKEGAPEATASYIGIDGDIPEKTSIFTESNLEEQILNVVRDRTERLTGREIAKILGRDKAEVNRCLYLTLRERGKLAHDSERRWYIPHERANAFQHPVKAA